jgi:LysR family transcriptional regulator, transcriptional activator of nhaA
MVVMEWLNYHHLFYFWTVCKEGSVSRAAEKLRLAQPTISGQLKVLEDSLGEALFRRAGRGLALTDVGALVYKYAEEIFSLGREMQDVLKGRPTGRPLRLAVGIAGTVPKLLSHQIILPAIRMKESVRLFCFEDRSDRLLARLAVHELDLVISDRPAGPEVSVRAYNHLLGESGTTFFATPDLAARLRRGFPRSLDGAPMLLPTEGSALRRSLELWLEAERIRPQAVADFDDSALMKVFAQEGFGVFAAPTVSETEVVRQYGVKAIGHADDVKERFYAISIEKRLKHPAVLAITEAARRDVFASGDPRKG